MSAASSSWTERSSHQVLLRVTSVDAKQVDSQLFLSKGGFNLALAQNCSLGSPTMQSHVQVPIQGGKETTFIKGQKKLRTRGNSESMAFHWLSPCQEGRGLPSSCWALASSQPVRASPSGLWGFCLFMFYTRNRGQSGNLLMSFSISELFGVSPGKD